MTSARGQSKARRGAKAAWQTGFLHKNVRMGLSININATAPDSLGIAEIETLVRRWHSLAQTFASEGLIKKVHGMSNKHDDLDRFASRYVSIPHPDDPDTITGVSVPPTEGWMFIASIGEGCEPLMLGFCRYPKFVSTRNGNGGGRKQLPTGAGTGWHFQTSCKTQYASTRGWEHFRRCHVAIIELAAAAESLGATVRIDDEGGWWPGRDDTALRRTLSRYNTLMAGLAGALKDSLDEDNTTPENNDGTGNTGASNRAPLHAAIFEHPDFERLEAESQSGGDSAKILEALRKIRGSLEQ